MQISNIKSAQNDLVKYAVKLQSSKYRKNSKKILIDGQKSVTGLIEQDFNIEYLFLKEDDEINQKYKTQIENRVENLVFVNDEILKKISTTKSPASIIAIIKEPKINKDIFKNMKKIVLIDGIKDAGNLGTIIRSAVAFSIEGIILFNECVDLYNTKTIRATAQNIFKIPIIMTSDINFIKDLKQNHKLISAVVNSNNDFRNYEFKENFILALGSEANGVSDEILSVTDDSLTLFMDNDVESLNLAVCASICFALIKI